MMACAAAPEIFLGDDRAYEHAERSVRQAWQVPNRTDLRDEVAENRVAGRDFVDRDGQRNSCHRLSSLLRAAATGHHACGRRSCWQS
jgi:hypothetical protein